MIFEMSRALSRQGQRILIVDFNKGLRSHMERRDGMIIYKMGIPLHILPRFNSFHLAISIFDSLLLCLFLLVKYRGISKLFPSADFLFVHQPVQVIFLHPFKWLLRLLGAGRELKLVFLLRTSRWMIPHQFTFGEKLRRYSTEVLAVRLADLVIFESEIIRHNILSAARVTLDKTLILHNGVNCDEWDPNKHATETDPYTIIWAARICEQKNQLEVVNAIPDVVARYPETKFLFVGPVEDMKYYDRLTKRISELEVGKHVAFSPPVTIESLRELYAKCAIHLVFSDHTGFDVALGENLASGRAIIVSNIPPAREVVTDMEDCVVVEPHDPIGLANSILMLLQDNVLRGRLSRNARLLAENKLEWSVLVRDLVTDLRTRVY